MGKGRVGGWGGEVGVVGGMCGLVCGERRRKFPIIACKRKICFCVLGRGNEMGVGAGRRVIKREGLQGGGGSVCYFILPAPARPGRTSWHMVGTVCPVLRTRPHKDYGRS